jgi:hypothetical protein
MRMPMRGIYLLFIRGTLIERVGIIDARPGTLIHGGQGRDGNAPGCAHARPTPCWRGWSNVAGPSGCARS